MKIVLSIVFVLVFIYGIFGRVPNFSKKVCKFFWRMYWVLVAVSLLVVLWADLPEVPNRILLVFGTSCISIPAVIVIGFS